MRRVRAGSRTGGVRASAAVAVGVVVLAALTAGCKDTPAGSTSSATPPGTAASSPDDAKPSGGPAVPSATATASATPGARPRR